MGKKGSTCLFLLPFYRKGELRTKGDFSEGSLGTQCLCPCPSQAKQPRCAPGGVALHQPEWGEDRMPFHMLHEALGTAEVFHRVSRRFVAQAVGSTVGQAPCTSALTSAACSAAGSSSCTAHLPSGQAPGGCSFPSRPPLRKQNPEG